MVDSTSRIFVTHAKQLFDATLLNRLAERLSALEANPGVAAAQSEREATAVARGEASDKLRMQDAWYDVWRTPPSRDAILHAIHPYTWVTYPVQVRHVRAVGHEVPWHQDVGYMKLHPEHRRHRRVITCFIPLEPEPWNHTTIQFCSDNKNEPDVEFDHASLSGFGAGLSGDRYSNVYHYDLTLGDALLFGDLTLHRTFTPPEASLERRSLEFRLIRPEDALPGKDYFDIAQQRYTTRDGTTKEKIHVSDEY